jgi:transcriptional regulator with XRE-family HTH domain
MFDWRDWRKRLVLAIDITRRTQASVAEEACVSQETVSRIIHGIHAQPGFETVVKIVYATHESVGWLLGEQRAPLSSEEMARMREIADFMGTVFLPLGRKVPWGATLPSALPSRAMTPAARMLASLEAVTAETVTMLDVLDGVESTRERREAKRRVLDIRGQAQELLGWLAAGGLPK